MNTEAGVPVKRTFGPSRMMRVSIIPRMPGRCEAAIELLAAGAAIINMPLKRRLYEDNVWPRPGGEGSGAAGARSTIHNMHTIQWYGTHVHMHVHGACSYAPAWQAVRSSAKSRGHKMRLLRDRATSWTNRSSRHWRHRHWPLCRLASQPPAAIPLARLLRAYTAANSARVLRRVHVHVHTHMHRAHAQDTCTHCTCTAHMRTLHMHTLHMHTPRMYTPRMHTPRTHTPRMYTAHSHRSCAYIGLTTSCAYMCMHRHGQTRRPSCCALSF